MAKPQLVPRMKAPRYCDFCGREEHEVAILIAGVNAKFICDICVEQARDVIAERRIARAAKSVAQSMTK